LIRQGLGNPGFQQQAFGIGLGSQEGKDIIADSTDLKLGFGKTELAPLDLGDIEHVIDDGEQGV